MFNRNGNDNERLLNTNWANAQNHWNADNRVVLRLSNSFFSVTSTATVFYYSYYTFVNHQAFFLSLQVALLKIHIAYEKYILPPKLWNQAYVHGSYHAFRLNDPKPRLIHKASVCDRLVHHAVYRTLAPGFDRFFIHDSYACRKGKGVHKALRRFADFGNKVSQNHTRTTWVLQCDIRKFFDSIDHQILLGILHRYITDDATLGLLQSIITSFSTHGKADIGLPLGNLTSQLLVNVYMNVFDQFVKRKLKMEYYIRYADDFVFLHHNRDYLEMLLPQVEQFLFDTLNLTLHPNKIHMKTLYSGIDFLGWVHFPTHRVLRTSTKRRMMRRLHHNPNEDSLQSYMGLLSHGDTYKLSGKVLRKYRIHSLMRTGTNLLQAPLVLCKPQ